MGLDWTTGFTKSRMREFGVHDLMSIVRRGDGTFFICQDADLKLLEANFRAHYKIDLTVRPVFAHQSLYDSAVYRVTIVDRPHLARDPSSPRFESASIVEEDLFTARQQS
jgi:hypothetical protein